MVGFAVQHSRKGGQQIHEFIYFRVIYQKKIGISLVVQWLRVHTPKGWGSIPDWGN